MLTSEGLHDFRGFYVWQAPSANSIHMYQPSIQYKVVWYCDRTLAPRFCSYSLFPGLLSSLSSCFPCLLSFLANFPFVQPLGEITMSCSRSAALVGGDNGVTLPLSWAHVAKKGMPILPARSITL
eukprot:1157065-Pelagomonas_calceolata.AAC.24